MTLIQQYSRTVPTLEALPALVHTIKPTLQLGLASSMTCHQAAAGLTYGGEVRRERVPVAVVIGVCPERGVQAPLERGNKIIAGVQVQQ